MKQRQQQWYGRLALLTALWVGHQTVLAAPPVSYETRVAFSGNYTNNPQCVTQLPELVYSGQKGSMLVTPVSGSDYTSVKEISRDTKNPNELTYVDEVKKAGLNTSITLKGSFDRATGTNSGTWFYANGACHGTFTHTTVYK